MMKDQFMPFGSLMNSYGQINQGKGIEAKKLVEEAKIIFDFCNQLVLPKEENNPTQQYQQPIKTIPTK